MASNKKDKLEHIQVKDNGIKLSNKIGDALKDTQTKLETDIAKGLVKNADDLTRWKIAQNNQLREFSKETRQVVKAQSKNIKETLKNDTSVNLTTKQSLVISKDIDKGLLFLEKSAIKTYQNIVQSTIRELRVNKAVELKAALQKHINTGLNIGVVYKDGKHFQFDTYHEMKARTDIQQDIGTNMVETGNANGVIFYITSFYGDCAKDHADYQGKIYVDKDWEANAPKDRLEEIRNYIASNKIMTVQEVMGAPVYLTTRPNCRHYFQYIDIDSVLGAKDKQAVRDLRTRRNLNFNGRYKPEKYKALQQQRYNERKIRAEKKEIELNEQLLALNPGNKELQTKILNGESRVRDIQKAQRTLIEHNSNLVRRYDREKLGNRITLGTEK